MSRTVKPRVSVGTMKPLMGFSPSSSARAHTIARSAIPPLVIQSLSPFSTQSDPRRRAVVRMPPGSEPKSGSVSPKQPIASPRAIRGSHSCFCSSDPYSRIGNITSEPWAETKLRKPESPASSSRQASP